MYQAKQAGKNRYHLFDPEQDRQAQTHHGSLEHIAHALKRTRVRAVLPAQGQHAHRRGRRRRGADSLAASGARAGARRGEFLPLIEGSELIVHIGDWVLDAALDADVAMARSQGLDLAGQRQYRRLCHLAAGRLSCAPARQAGGAPRRAAANLELEVLETGALEGVSRISTSDRRLPALGVRFSLDDFGTGYSSLTYLRRLPASMLKIDQSFVRDMLWDPEDLAIVEGVIGLAAAFRRTVIAEGVETAEHGELLLRLGCDQAQGYGIARPMPAEGARRNLCATRDDLPLMYAEVELRHWVKCVESCFVNATSVQTAADLCEYRFGNWYQADGQNQYGRLTAFGAIGPLQEALLALGKELTTLWADGHAEHARNRQPELHTLRHELTQHLHALLEESVEARQVLRFPLF
jgi:EAL domain-containing protein (putative c-di-GMP-specific phosphodiesterase class I)